MIAFLKGRVISKQEESQTITLLDSNIGYEITLHKSAFDPITVQSEISLWIHTHVREDLLQLYGFISEKEKALFRILLSVSGLGPRTAMNLLSQHGAASLSQAIITKDLARISEASGVGKKLAERITLELSTKLQKLHWIQDLQVKSKTHTTSPIEHSLREDLHSALLNLGYPIQQVRPIVERILENPKELNEELNFEICLKNALGEMSGHTKVSHGNTLSR